MKGAERWRSENHQALQRAKRVKRADRFAARQREGAFYLPSITLIRIESTEARRK